MSFILDALRKADQQRQRSAPPTLATAPAPAAQSRQTALWWYGLLAAVLMSVGILIGWMHQWQPEPALQAIPPDASRSVESNTTQLASAPLPALPVPPAKPENPHSSRESSAVAQSIPSPSGARTPMLMPIVNRQPTAAAASPGEEPAPVPEEHAHPGAGDAARESAAMAPTELPPALQQEIPKLVILIHSYSSNPKSRFVFINDRKWREDEYPVPGLKLEQITPDGVIFIYKGYRFRRGINP
jgi:general secretion pathway protein B